MSGHSKWAQIRRQKGVNDAKRGQMFTKVGREITVAARQGGGDPDANYRLRLTIQKAKQINMPQENIERAIKRGAGGGEAAALEEFTYEGYGPAGVAMLLEVATDNRNRAAAEIRNVFTRNGANLGETGCVAWLFDPKGVVTVEADDHDPEEIGLLAIDAGADDVHIDGRTIEIYTQPNDLEWVRETMTKRKLNVVSAERTMLPKSTVPLNEAAALKTLRLVDKLEELDDVLKVYFNADIPIEVMEKYEG
jgi:YebC/PmpR family DNA-binding regulatory protein